MKFAMTLILVVALSSISTTVAVAEDTAGAAQSVETLRLQLLEVESREAELQAKAKQLDEDLKPENIERALAGIGSTRPEELRETQRRQLTIERDSVRARLRLLTTSRERLESVIRTAETQAYQQSADGGSPLLNHATSGKQWSFVWLIGTVALAGEILGIAVLVIVAMKRLRTVN